MILKKKINVLLPFRHCGCLQLAQCMLWWKIQSVWKTVRHSLLFSILFSKNSLRTWCHWECLCSEHCAPGIQKDNRDCIQLQNVLRHHFLSYLSRVGIVMFNTSLSFMSRGTAISSAIKHYYIKKASCSSMWSLNKSSAAAQAAEALL